MQPMERLVDDILAPVVGLGLLFLLSRQLFLTQIGASNSIFSDPIWFAGIVLIVLYSAAAVAIMVEISFFGFRRSEDVRMVFQNQMVELHDPVIYSFTREHDRMELNPLRSLKEHLMVGDNQIEQKEAFNFEDMLRTPSTLQEGEDALPPEKPDFKVFKGV